MILKASQRGGPRQLAAHLLNDRDNDHVVLQELRGFVSADLYGAMAETTAIAKGTRCTQPVFSLNLNPPKEVSASIDDLMQAVERAEAVLGLHDQPRAIVIHEKNGRRHAHAVWSRISPEEMKAINMPFFKAKLGELSRDLYLEHGWELPEGHRTNNWKNPLNFTLAEWQQAKRIDLDPREIKQVFRSAWARSDTFAGFKNALEEHGYFLAKGDRRGIVALGLQGDVYSVSRWSGIKTKELNSRMGNMETLPGLDQVRSSVARRISGRMRLMIAEDKANKRLALKPHSEQLRMLVSHHRKERALLHDKQESRKATEGRDRAARFRRGLGAVMDLLTGRLFAVKRQNERETYEAFVRDRQQIETLVRQQMEERRELERQKEELQKRHQKERTQLVKRVIAFTRAARQRNGPDLEYGR